MCKPGSAKAHDNVSAQVYILTKEEGGFEKPVIPMQQLHIFSRTWDSAAQLTIHGKDMVMGGEDAKWVRSSDGGSVGKPFH